MTAKSKRVDKVPKESVTDRQKRNEEAHESITRVAANYNTFTRVVIAVGSANRNNPNDATVKELLNFDAGNANPQTIAKQLHDFLKKICK
jgi:hypothetical protein